ncbi:MAG: hypothetical protein DBY45_04545 [Clostridiales bacterium]|nr:MAG: hypothetical protein DBY45_04545 [Clostridiales bacterium]
MDSRNHNKWPAASIDHLSQNMLIKFKKKLSQLKIYEAVIFTVPCGKIYLKVIILNLLQTVQCDSLKNLYKKFSVSYKNTFQDFTGKLQFIYR